MRGFTLSASWKWSRPAIVAGCLAFAAMAAAPSIARAQIGDADRKAARDLFFQGVDLQNAGKFGDALDKFQRAQAVVNAPTNLLHIAECQAALGKMVEAAETYRAVARFPMPANPPQAFVAAQSQAAGELAQLEPRIPEVTVEVTPANVPTLQVTIDDQPIPAALVGVSRPLNPGPHKIAAQAAGYGREEKTVDVKEKSKQKVTLDLKSNGAVTYGPAGAAAGAPPAGLVATQPSGGQQTDANAQPPKPEKPAPYDPGKQPEPRSRMSIFLGPRLGAMVPTGDVAFSNGNTDSLNKYSGAGIAFGAEAGFRFVRVLYFGGLVQAEGYGDGSQSSTLTRSSNGGVAALTFGWISNPHGFGVIFNAGAGYRWYKLENQVPTLGGGNTSVSAKANGGVFQLGFGLHIKLGRVFRLIPKTEVDFGSLTVSNPDANREAAQAGTAFIYFGLGGIFDINLDKSAAPVPAQSGLRTTGLGPM